MSNARNLGELLEADGEVPSGKIDSVDSSKLTGTVSVSRLAAGSIDSAHVAAGAIDDAHISGLAATKLTGTVAAARLSTATTQAESDDSTKIATTAYVVDKITTLIGGAPSTLNDLNELALAINDDASYNSTLTTALATKMPLAGGAFTGAVTTNSTIDGRDVAADGVTADAALPKAGGTMTGNLTLSGADIVKSGSADLTLDIGGRINLSADDSGEIRLYDGSSLYAQFKDDDDRFRIEGLIADKDIMFIVNDGGVATTALKIDAASGGDATFYGNITAKSYDASAMGVTKWYQPSNSGNPEFYIGSSDANRLGIQTVYDSGSQNLAYTHFFTHTANNSADAGRMIFSVDDGNEKLRINDAGIAVTGMFNLTGSSSTYSPAMNINSNTQSRAALAIQASHTSLNNANYGVLTLNTVKASGTDFDLITAWTGDYSTRVFDVRGDGAVTATSFTGSGSGLTNLPAQTISSWKLLYNSNTPVSFSQGGTQLGSLDFYYPVSARIGGSFVKQYDAATSYIVTGGHYYAYASSNFHSHWMWISGDEANGIHLGDDIYALSGEDGPSPRRKSKVTIQSTFTGKAAGTYTIYTSSGSGDTRGHTGVLNANPGLTDGDTSNAAARSMFWAMEVLYT